jgi:aminoglycoside 6'-N-acetyltransferase
VIDVDFRPLTRADFPDPGRWLSEPTIAWWWADDPSLAAIEKEYGDAIDGIAPGEAFIVEIDGGAAGLIQRYYWRDEPSYVAEVAPFVTLPARAMSIDYLLRDGARGGGRGTAMIGEFVERLWRDHPDCPCIIVPVHADNRASWRALERNGFVRIAECELEPDNPEHTRDHVIYRLDRPGVASAAGA